MLKLTVEERRQREKRKTQRRKEREQLDPSLRRRRLDLKNAAQKRIRLKQRLVRQKKYPKSIADHHDDDEAQERRARHCRRVKEYNRIQRLKEEHDPSLREHRLKLARKSYRKRKLEGTIGSNIIACSTSSEQDKLIVSTLAKKRRCEEVGFHENDSFPRFGHATDDGGTDVNDINDSFPVDDNTTDESTHGCLFGDDNNEPGTAGGLLATNQSSCVAKVDRYELRHDRNVLFLGMVYDPFSSSADVETIKKAIFHRKIPKNKGRDVVRCIATEKTCQVNVFTVSNLDNVDNDGQDSCIRRHIIARMGQRDDLKTISKGIPDGIRFEQIIWDPFNSPSSWFSERLSQGEFFSRSVIGFAMDSGLPLLSPTGSVFLPFNKEVATQVLLREHIYQTFYDIIYLTENEAKGKIHLLTGTATLDPVVLRDVFDKNLYTQLPTYCRTTRQMIGEDSELNAIAKERSKNIPNIESIRFVQLRKKMPLGTPRGIS